jgi:hypothetical protein
MPALRDAAQQRTVQMHAELFSGLTDVCSTCIVIVLHHQSIMLLSTDRCEFSMA